MASLAAWPLALAALLAAAGGASVGSRTPATWDVVLAPPGEPGEPLVVTGRVLHRRDHRPLAGMTVYVYHADGRGLYFDRLGASEPRLAAILRTNAGGEYRFRTVMPGAYGGSQRGHIHYEVWGPRVARHAFVLDFEDGPVPSDPSGAERGTRARRGNSPPGRFQLFQDLLSRRKTTDARQRLWRDAAGVLHCRRDLLVG